MISMYLWIDNKLPRTAGTSTARAVAAMRRTLGDMHHHVALIDAGAALGPSSFLCPRAPISPKTNIYKYIMQETTTLAYATSDRNTDTAQISSRTGLCCCRRLA